MFTKMNPDVKPLILAALRSDKYKQGRGQLKRVERSTLTKDIIDTYHCCLGVICEVFHEVTGRGEWDRDYIFDTNNELGPDNSSYLLPLLVSQWAGMNYQGEYDKNKLSLMAMNDNGSTFERIADVIEKEF